MPKLSIVVPVYNGEKYVEKCLDSVLEQTYKDIEVIIVDDGSNDRTGKICDSYLMRDDRIRVIHQENKGVIQARYVGTKYSTGEYVTYLDGDDFVDELSYEIAAEDMNEHIDAIVFDIASYYEDRDKSVRSNELREGLYKKNDIQDVIFPKLIWDFERYDNSIVPSLGVVILKRKFAIHQYVKIKDKKFWFGEDLAIALPVYKYFNTLRIYEKCYYNYRRRNERFPSYINNNDYIDGLYELYKYLLREFNFEDDKYKWRKQIEYFFIYSVGLRKKIYNDYKSIRPNYFPFDKIPKGKKIALYGAGDIGHEYKKQITQLNYVQNLIWVDRNYKNIDNKEIISPDELDGKEIDFVVVAIEDKDVCEIVKKYLENKGIASEKIIY